MSWRPDAAAKAAAEVGTVAEGEDGEREAWKPDTEYVLPLQAATLYIFRQVPHF